MDILIMFCCLIIKHLLGSLHYRWQSLQFFACFLLRFMIIFQEGECNFLFQNFQQIIVVGKIVYIIIPTLQFVLLSFLEMVNNFGLSSHEWVTIKSMNYTYKSNILYQNNIIVRPSSYFQEIEKVIRIPFNIFKFRVRFQHDGRQGRLQAKVFSLLLGALKSLLQLFAEIVGFYGFLRRFTLIATQHLSFGLPFADYLMGQISDFNIFLPVFSVKLRVSEYENIFFGFFFMEIVQVQLANKARKFSQTEINWDDFTLHPRLVLDDNALPAAIPADYFFVFLILLLLDCYFQDAKQFSQEFTNFSLRHIPQNIQNLQKLKKNVQKIASSTFFALGFPFCKVSDPHLKLSSFDVLLFGVGLLMFRLQQGA